MSTFSALPLRLERFIKEKNDIIKQLPEGTELDIDITDINVIGIIIAVLCVILVVLSFIFLLFSTIKTPLSHPKHVVLGYALLSLCTILFAVMIPFDRFFDTRSAAVSASIGGEPVAPSIIKIIERALGISTRYKEHHYRKLKRVKCMRNTHI